MKVFVTGAAGMLGSCLCPVLRERGHTVCSTDLAPEQEMSCVDVRLFSEVKRSIEKVEPDIVIHLAAEVDADKCEMEPDHAYLTNTIGTQNVALVCQHHEIEMVYVSTMEVFSGDKSEHYTEFDQPNPVNIYGKSKLEAEKIVQSLLKKYYIVRTCWLMGGGPRKDKKFVGKVVRMLNQMRELKVVDDKFGNLTYAVDFSKCLANLIETRYYGLYHCANKGSASRYEIAKKIAEYLGKNDVSIVPVRSAYFPLPAVRPRSEACCNYKLGLLGLNSMRRWEEALHEYIETSWKSVG